jgi:DNA-binding transcriptional ArsR family regulator
LLRAESACVCHLMAVLNRPQPYISQQLAVLRDAGLVIDDKQGLNVFYQVRDQRVYELIDQVRGMLGNGTAERSGWRPGVVSGPVRLANCPCPKCQAMAA